MSETEIATIPISSDDWPEPIEVIELPAGYTWQMFSRWGPHFLCKDGSPIEATGKYGNTWRVTHEQGPQQELEIFARDIRSSLSKKDEEIGRLKTLLDHIDTTLQVHGHMDKDTDLHKRIQEAL